MNTTGPKPSPARGAAFERIFERILWSTRFTVLIPVVLGLVSAAILFLIASGDILTVVKDAIMYYTNHADGHELHEKALGTIIGAIDLYLIGIVMLIFSFGLYELFVSRVDVAREDKTDNPLEVASLEDLKTKLMKVVVIVLVVKYFQVAIAMDFGGALDIFYLALGILAICIGMYFLHKE